MIEKIAYYTIYFATILAIEVSLLLLTWNYCISDFLGMDKMGFAPAVGFIILFRVFFSPEKPNKEKTDDLQKFNLN